MFELFKKETESSETSQTPQIGSYPGLEASQLEQTENQITKSEPILQEIDDEQQILSSLQKIRTDEQSLLEKKQDLMTLKINLEKRLTNEIQTKKKTVSKLETEILSLEDEVMQLYNCFEPSLTD